MTDTTRLTHTLSIIVLMAGGAAGAASVAASPPQDLIPREVLFGNPDRAGVQISPDGTQLAWLAPHNDVLNVWVGDAKNPKAAEPVTNSTTRPISTYFWAENGKQIIYQQDSAGDENFHLYSVDLRTKKLIDLTPMDNIQARILATDRTFPNEILASINNRVPQLHDVYRINTRTGERSLVLQNDRGFVGFVPDSDFNIRIGMQMLPTGGQAAWMHDPETGDWQQVAEWSMEDMMTSGPVGFSRDGNWAYYLDSRDRNTAALFKANINEDGTPELVASNPKADLSGAMIDPDTGHVQAVSFEYTRTSWDILDDSIRSDWEYLQSVADGDLNITSRSNDDRTWTVAYMQDAGPVRYYLYDRDARKAMYLFSNRSALEGVALAKMKPVVIKARDGLNLVSYLTTPVGMEARNLPMVLLVHGGPWGRDSWGYNGLHQWLANRGYAVLSVNFRGSTGFGKDFINAGNREWAAKMHTDLLDAVQWAVDKNIADPDRVAIMGGSYGGYATLVGLTFTPDTFAAGVDIVGPSHIKTLLESIPPYWEPIKAMFEVRVGALDEEEYLDSISPLTKVDQISKPLLIGQGANDPRVKEAESQQIVDAMQQRDIPVTYVLFPDEGHGFRQPNNSMAFWAVTEVFLAQHLGGNYEPIDDDLANSSAQVKAGADLLPGLEK